MINIKHASRYLEGFTKNAWQRLALCDNDSMMLHMIFSNDIPSEKVKNILENVLFQKAIKVRVENEQLLLDILRLQGYVYHGPKLLSMVEINDIVVGDVKFRLDRVVGQNGNDKTGGVISLILQSTNPYDSQEPFEELYSTSSYRDVWRKEKGEENETETKQDDSLTRYWSGTSYRRISSSDGRRKPPQSDNLPRRSGAGTAR